MPSQYQAQRPIANQLIDKLFREALDVSKGGRVSIPNLILQVTSQFSVSEGHVRNRLSLLVQANKDFVQFDGNEIINKEVL